MKIDPQVLFPDQSRSTGNVGQPGSSSTPNRPEGNATASDQVHFSVPRQAIDTLAGTASSPDIRWERVAQLQKAIHKGTYQVTPRQIADAIFSEFFAPASQGR